MFEKKGALRRVPKHEREQIKKEHPDVIPLPAKLVVTRKAGGKRKVRIVACGNYADRREGEDLFASGSDCISLRLALRRAVNQGWEGATADVRTAFLNAPISGTAEEDPDYIVLISPPRLLVRLGFARPDETWLAVKAMYGLRQSPKAWSDYRDSVVAQMQWEEDGLQMSFVPLLTDPNVWKIMASGEGFYDEERGLMLVYVDELMLLGPERTVRKCLERISQEWELSTPEWLNRLKAVRFLGMGVLKVPQGIFLSQEDYIKELLQKNGEEETYGSGVPITKDQVAKLEVDDDEKNAESIRLAQKATGELMWVCTSTRPDLMYTMSCMSRYTLKSPLAVIEVGELADAAFALAGCSHEMEIGEGRLVGAGDPGSLQLADIGTKVMTAPKLTEMRRMMSVEELQGLKQQSLDPEGERIEERGEQVRDMSEVIQKAAHLLRVATITGGVIGAKGEGHQSGDEVDWMFALLVLFAGISLISVLRGAWLVGRAWWCSIEERGEEEREEKLMTPVHGRLTPGVELRGALEVGDDSQTSSRASGVSRTEENPVVSEEAGRDERAPENTLAMPELDPESWRRSRAIITPWGEKYHVNQMCPTLSATRRVKFSPWCQACVSHPRHRGPLFSVGPGKVAHARADCPRIDRLAVGYLRCLVCAQREERLEQARP